MSVLAEVRQEDGGSVRASCEQGGNEVSPILGSHISSALFFFITTII